MSKEHRQRAIEEAARLTKVYGHKAGGIGSDEYSLDVIPTGSLALDYALGMGGWPRGWPVEVYGERDIGKSSIVGFNAIRNAQKMGLFCGIVGIEPGFDPTWAEKNGVDPEKVVVARPDTGEDAFAILHEWVTDDLIDLIIFDSIGGVLSESEVNEKGKPKVGGQAGLISWGAKRIVMPTFKHNKSVIFLNQIRDDMNVRYHKVKAPGGHALEHSCPIIVYLKSPPSNAIKVPVPGQKEPVTIGRTVIAVIERNKLAEGTGKRAEFDYYQMETESTPVGIDTGKDVISTAIRTRVIEKAGAWFRHHTFPGEKHQFQGREPAEAFLLGNPKALREVRGEVLKEMVRKVSEAKEKKATLEVVDG